MTTDFKIKKVYQTNKIITSGSTGRNAQLLIYPHLSSDGLDNGGIDSSRFPATGIGEDVFLFISGTTGGKDSSGNGVVSFGGDVHISGALHLENQIFGIDNADANAEYIVSAATGSLANERVLAAGSGITIDDYGSIIGVSGSSAGAPTDANYIVLSSTSSLTNEKTLTAGNSITINEYATTVAVSSSNSAVSSWIWSPDIPPTSSSELDDEFTGSYAVGLPAGWSQYGGYGYLQPIVTGDGFLELTMSFTPFDRNEVLYKNIPSGTTDFTIFSKFTIAHHNNDDTTANIYIGAFVGEGIDAAPTTANMSGVAVRLSNNFFTPYRLLSTGGDAFTTTYNAQSVGRFTDIYIKVVVSGNYMASLWSRDGIGWQMESTQDWWLTASFVPDIQTVGIFTRNDSTNGTTENCTVKCQFFRFFPGINDPFWVAPGGFI